MSLDLFLIFTDQGDIEEMRLLPQFGEGLRYIVLEVIPLEAKLLGLIHLAVYWN